MRMPSSLVTFCFVALLHFANRHAFEYTEFDFNKTLPNNVGEFEQNMWAFESETFALVSELCDRNFILYLLCNFEFYFLQEECSDIIKVW